MKRAIHLKITEGINFVFRIIDMKLYGFKDKNREEKGLQGWDSEIGC